MQTSKGHITKDLSNVQSHVGPPELIALDIQM